MCSVYILVVINFDFMTSQVPTPSQFLHDRGFCTIVFHTKQYNYCNMLKSTVYSIAPQITKLFNKSIMSGKLPSSWKLSSVVPVPKGNDNTNVANYRPISLLPIVSKLLERHMYWVIAKHFELHSPISIYQWGFQPRKSTTAALLNVYNDWSAALDRGKEVLCNIF